MKTIAILGSTGSIGTQALDIVKKSNNKFKVEYLSANSDYKTLFEQIKVFSPNYACINNEDSYRSLKNLLDKDSNTEILFGEKENLDLISNSKVDLILNAIVGVDGLKPTIAAIKSNIDIALSNKESLVLAGQLVTELANKNNTKIFPVDSEHSAIWQCLRGESSSEINKLILTASGGPFRKLKKEDFKHITIESALNHPNWKMGKKITIDSATMMNKGFEVIEAYWVFSISPEKIQVLVHPESIIHSMVEFNDKSIKAQIGLPDMKVPINYALNYPAHSFLDIESINFSKISKLTFENPNFEKFNCIKLAYDCLDMGGTAPAVLNAANDFLVDCFLNKRICFNDIPKYIEFAINKHPYLPNPSLDDIYHLID